MSDSHSHGISSACVDAPTLAAFVDGQLDPAERAKVITHLASCAECAELVGEVVGTSEELDAEETVVSTRKVRHTFWTGRRRLTAVGGIAAIAASLLLFVVTRGSALDPLVAVVGDERLIVARPTGGFHYGPLRSPVRGSSESGDLRLAAEAARLRERAAETGAAGDLHASGVAALVSGNTAGALDSLQAARTLKPGDATFIADLGAAYMTRFIERDDPRDATAALDAFNQALSISPSFAEAWFNKAVLLERMNRPADALSAWTTYLGLSDDPRWRDEATRARDALQRRLNGR